MTYRLSSGAADPSSTLPVAGRVPNWTWQAVEDRLVEAMRCWRRSPDAEARFAIGGRISSAWQHYAPSRRDLALWDMLLELQAPTPRALPLSRAEVADMLEASDWLRLVREDDRRLVVIALGILASGAAAVPWMKLKRTMNIAYGADGLRKRYSRALTDVAKALEKAGPTQQGAGERVARSRAEALGMAGNR